jgi:hypothetical protein
MFELAASLAMLMCGLTAAADKPAAWVEAESFADLGGWVVDQQFMDQMGSPVVLAHGLGQPVADAVTTVAFPAPGKYHLWVRTRDWVAPWGAAGAPGRFQVLIDGQAVDTVFGTDSAEWAWQDGGVVDIASESAALALRDLTGFDGRCDAIAFTAGKTPPPDSEKALAKFRRRALGLPHTPPDAGAFDLVVAGGGMAGTCAAITAARLGLQVALIQDRPVLGGNNSSEVRVHLNGEINLPPYPALGNVVRELDSGKKGNAQPAENYADDQKLRIARAEKNLHLFLNMHASRVEMKGKQIAAVVATDILTGAELRFAAPLFADCTGDGSVGYLAGADFRMGREGRGETGESLAPETADPMTLGASAQWYSVETDEPAPFPDCPWALPFTEETCQRATAGEWNWEVGLHQNQITEFEAIRDHAFRAVYGNWAFLKNHSADRDQYARRQLAWLAHIAGKRESRRLLGDVILQQQDVEGRREFPDACVTTTWSIDLHYPDPKNEAQFPGQTFRAICEQQKIEPYAIPYRCLYSRNVPNLFMAGRNISVTHVALGTVRVMRTGGMMGEVTGMAAALCRKLDASPREIYEKHLEALKEQMRQGAPAATAVSAP